jgi:hypothetical protein
VGDVETIKVLAQDSITSAALSGATINLTVYTAAGGSFSTSGYTDATGTALFQMRTRNKDGIGSYSLRAQASKSGYVDNVLTVSNAFTVK